MNNLLINKLHEGLRAKYSRQTCECCDVVECLKVATALKLWYDREHHDIEFSVPFALRKKKFFVDVLAHKENCVVVVECMPSLNLGWLRVRMALLHRCLPPSAHYVIVFPSSEGKRVDKAAILSDEIWVTNEDNSKVANIMFV
ncbi:MAG: hypothetical protein ACFCUE_10190 [Candidatus Bathyarchaeia archaeon]|jgi:hypothetical protein